MATYELLKQEGSAKRAVFHTVHGDIQTPVFMNVGTVAAIKGAVSTMDLKEIKCQVELSSACIPVSANFNLFWFCLIFVLSGSIM